MRAGGFIIPLEQVISFALRNATNLSGELERLGTDSPDPKTLDNCLILDCLVTARSFAEARHKGVGVVPVGYPEYKEGCQLTLMVVTHLKPFPFRRFEAIDRDHSRLEPFVPGEHEARVKAVLEEEYGFTDVIFTTAFVSDSFFSE
ncbi:hypothetical protein E1B28_003279 [Marasmius oreades]|uniref:Uncharacterized protein n=1 Tax=Marasmius oreades TaxID=181124 RepID=A0A9P7RL03_9AGAR|nr:uncharacterized protein E1B28_003279 [Marasmius oreades]KAG7085736.1 hypothetical protein E1B28_003279 [Marasmius oreades]